MSTEDLYSQLKHKNPKLRERAMYQIVEDRTEETIPQLMAILGEEDVVYRRAAVQTLGLIGMDSVPSLLEYLNSEDETIRASCAKALAAIALKFSDEPFPTEALEALQKALQDPNPVVKISAVGALGTVGKPAFEILVEALKIKEDIGLRVAVINALGSLGDERGMEVLSAMAADESDDPYIKESATSAVSRLEQVINYAKARPNS